MIKKILILSLVFIPTISFGATYGSNFLTGGTASASSYENASYLPSYAVDFNLATAWASTWQASFPQYWLYDLGSGTTRSVDKISFTPVANSNGVFMKTWELYGSNDNSSYTFIASSSISNTTTNNIS